MTEKERGMEGEGANIKFECGLGRHHKHIHMCDTMKCKVAML
jgi:hypothetical protein